MFKKMQGRIKESSRSFALLLGKILTGFILGLTVALIVRAIVGSGNFVFTLTIVACAAVFVRIAQKWKPAGVLLFNLFCVMTAMLLRMYIMLAPGH
jgi:cell shape-determining protein MreD